MNTHIHTEAAVTETDRHHYHSGWGGSEEAEALKAWSCFTPTHRAESVSHSWRLLPVPPNPDVQTTDGDARTLRHQVETFTQCLFISALISTSLLAWYSNLQKRATNTSSQVFVLHPPPPRSLHGLLVPFQTRGKYDKASVLEGNWNHALFVAVVLL